jgi:Flp pilus assembly protein TadG
MFDVVSGWLVTKRVLRLAAPTWNASSRIAAAFREWTSQRPWLLRNGLGAWCRGEEGVSAVEFAFFAPVLFFLLIATVDIGLAAYERMTIDQALRAGAQSAMANQDEDTILHVLEMTAAKNFTVSTDTASAGDDVLIVSVDRLCTCPASSTVVTCSTICSGTVPTFVYYRLSATKTYKGMVLPAINFSPSVLVQIR